MKIILYLFLISVLFFTSTLKADNYYVDPINGSDETGDGSENNPWRTLTFATSHIEGTISNVHTIHLKEGIYSPETNGEDFVIYLDPWENISGEGADKSIIKKSWLYYTSNVETDNLFIEYIKFLDKNPDLKFTYCILRYFLYYDDGLKKSNIRFYNCTFWIGNYPLILDPSGKLEITYVNCIFYYSFHGRGSKLTMRNYYSCIKTKNVFIEYYGENGGYNSIIADPQFIDPIKPDLHLRFSSPCRQAGTPEPPPDSNIPPFADLGALPYQYKPYIYIKKLEIYGSNNENGLFPDGVSNLYFTLINYGESALDVVARLSTDSPEIINIISDEIYFGDIPQGVYKKTEESFIVEIPDLEPPYPTVKFYLQILANNSYSKTYEIEIPIGAPNFYVDSEMGSDDFGDGSMYNPWRSLTYALSIVKGDRFYPVNLYINYGIYSEDTTNENFPLFLKEYVNLIGIPQNNDLPQIMITDIQDFNNTYILKTKSCTSIKNLEFFSNINETSLYVGITVDNINIYNNIIENCRFIKNEITNAFDISFAYLSKASNLYYEYNEDYSHLPRLGTEIIRDCQTFDILNNGLCLRAEGNFDNRGMTIDLNAIPYYSSDDPYPDSFYINSTFNQASVDISVSNVHFYNCDFLCTESRNNGIPDCRVSSDSPNEINPPPLFDRFYNCNFYSYNEDTYFAIDFWKFWDGRFYNCLFRSYNYGRIWLAQTYSIVHEFNSVAYNILNNDVFQFYCNGFKVINCISWNCLKLSGCEISYTDADILYEGEGNISEDPLFVDAENDDFHLLPQSPCIDAGNPDPDFNDPDGSRNDMGIYGGPLYDDSPPIIAFIYPPPDSQNISPYTPILFEVYDEKLFVDPDSISLRINGEPVNFEKTLNWRGYTISYEPPEPFNEGDEVSVQIYARDLAITPHPTSLSYNFTIWTTPPTPYITPTTSITPTPLISPTPTPSPSVIPPKILAGGFLNTYLTSNSNSKLKIGALILKGSYNIDSVFLAYQNYFITKLNKKFENLPYIYYEATLDVEVGKSVNNIYLNIIVIDEKGNISTFPILKVK